MKIIIYFTLAFFFCFIAMARPILYTGLEKYSGSDLIVEARVLSVKVNKRFKIKIIDVLKGNLKQTEVLLPYRSIYRGTTESKPINLTKGENVILFLKKIDDAYEIFGGWQGKISGREIDLGVYKETIMSLSKLSSEGALPESFEEINAMLSCSDIKKRAALNALFKCDEISEEDKEKIRKNIVLCLKSKDIIVRRDAITILGKFKYIGEVSNLVESLKDTSVAVWSAADTALQNITKRNKFLPPNSTPKERLNAIREWNMWLEKKRKEQTP